jgi:hypothetical protein
VPVPPRPNGRLRSEPLDLDFGIDENGLLRIYTPGGERLRTHVEAEQERLEATQRAAAEAVLRHEAEHRAAAAEARLRQEAQHRAAEAALRQEAQQRAADAEQRAAAEQEQRRALERRLAELEAELKRREPPDRADPPSA